MFSTSLYRGFHVAWLLPKLFLFYVIPYIYRGSSCLLDTFMWNSVRLIKPDMFKTQLFIVPQNCFSISICGSSIHLAPHVRNLGALFSHIQFITRVCLPILPPKYILHMSICPLSHCLSDSYDSVFIHIFPILSILYSAARLVFEKCKSNQVIPLKYK